LALVALSVIEQRYRAVMAVLDGASVTEVAAEVGVSRQSVHAWVARYRKGGLGGLADRSHRTRSCPHQASSEVEAVVCELRRAHPRWGAQRILHELMRGPASPEPLPSRATVNRILVRHGLVIPRARRKKRSEYVRWQRPAAMQLWQLDILFGPRLVDTATGEVREARIVTGIDDHSRYCVLARVVERATGRAVCLAFTEALQRYGAPEEVLTDNGKQFTDRFGRGGEVLFDKICRRNGITHRLTQPRSPTTTGKVERFHQTLRRELLDDARPFVSLLEAQAALDDWVRDYNADRPHQSLELREPVTPAQRFEPVPPAARELLPLWLPGSLASVPAAQTTPTAERAVDAGADGQLVEGGPVEFERMIPPSGNLWAMGRQFWLGPDRAGQTVRVWASVDVIHLTINGARVKSLRSHLSVADLVQLAKEGAVGAGPPPLPPPEDGAAIEVDRAVNKGGIVSLAGRQVLAAEILGGRSVIIRIEPQTLMFVDPQTRELLRVRPNPLTREQTLRLQGARPAGPATPATDRTRHRSAPRQRHRRDHRLPPAHRARARPRRPHRPRPRLRAHARDRARRRNPHDPPHHHPARRRRQGQPAAPSPGNVNRTLGQRGTGNGATHIDPRTMNPTTPTRPRPSVKHQPRQIRKASAETAQL
jgi:transposase InsO family protein